MGCRPRGGRGEPGRRSVELREVRRGDLEVRGASGAAKLARGRRPTLGKKEKAGEVKKAT